jgi:hypothetical protein
MRSPQAKIADGNLHSCPMPSTRCVGWTTRRRLDGSGRLRSGTEGRAVDAMNRRVQTALADFLRRFEGSLALSGLRPARLMWNVNIDIAEHDSA